MANGNTEVFGWIFDFACSKMWEEFQEHHTVDAVSGRSFMTGVIEYALDNVMERVHRLELFHLLCLLADADDPDLRYQPLHSGAGENEEDCSPLETACEMVTDMLAKEIWGPLAEEVGKMQEVIKIQAVMVFLRKKRLENAKTLVGKFWPKTRKLRSGSSEKDSVKTLTDLTTGKKNASFCKEHTIEKFYQAVMPTLKKMHDHFEEPFLLQVLKKKEQINNEKDRVKVIPYRVLTKACGPQMWKQILELSDKMAKESWAQNHLNSSANNNHSASTSNITPVKSPPKRSEKRSSATKRRVVTSSSSTASSSSGDEQSPVKRGKTIRDVKYGQTRRAPPTADAAAEGERVTWSDDNGNDDGDNNSDENMKPRVSHNKLTSPTVRRSLDVRVAGVRSPQVPSYRRVWTVEEEEELRKGIERFGVGKWAEIKLAFRFNNRTNVQLKDKYRTMVKQGLL